MSHGVVGLDLSLTGTGMVRFGSHPVKGAPNNRTLEVIRTISTKKSDDNTRTHRCWYIANQIIGSSLKTDRFFIEEYAYRIKNNASSLATLGELTGVVQLLFWRWTGRVPIFITAGQWKKFLCDNGSLNKDAFKLKVFQKFGVECATNDEAAAFGIADLAWNLHTLDRTLLKYEEKLIAKMKKDRKFA